MGEVIRVPGWMMTTSDNEATLQPDPERIDQDLRSIGVIRKLARLALLSHNVTSDTIINDVCLAVSEISTNGIEHDGGILGVSVTFGEEDSVELKVVNAIKSNEQPAVIEPLVKRQQELAHGEPDLMAESGRGVWIVEALARRVDQTSENGRRTTRALF